VVLAGSCPNSTQAGRPSRHALTSFDPAEAQRHLERALEIWPRVPDAAQRTGLDQAGVATLAGEAAYQAGAIDRSLSLFDQALAGLPAETDAARRALVLDHRARALRDTGRESEAITTLEEALALLPADQVTRAHAVVLSSLAMSVWRANDMDATMSLAARAVQARRTRLSLDDPAADAVAPAAEDPLAGFGLTDREREILVLLAAGRSNPQIAEALFISPKTASVHVSNILAKLGVDSRVEAAAVAHRLGVTG
jgi:DNA-binding CsgD family transcriptional regulator